MPDFKCNSECHCDYVKFSPVCGEDGHTYISACHAGCSSETIENGQKVKIIIDVCIIITRLYLNKLLDLYKLRMCLQLK